MKYSFKQNLCILIAKFYTELKLYKRCARSQQTPGASLSFVLFSHTRILLSPNTAVP